MSPELPEALGVLFQVTDIFNEIGVHYHLGGSYASSIHGVPRQTQDIDLVLDLHIEDVEALVMRLENEFYLDIDSIRDAIHNKSSVNLIHLASGIKLDFFMRGDSPFDLKEFSRSRLEPVTIAPQRRIYVKTAEDILLRKLQWCRLGREISDRQWNDILGIIKTQTDKLDVDYLKYWAEELQVADLLEHSMEE